MQIFIIFAFLFFNINKQNPTLAPDTQFLTCALPLVEIYIKLGKVQSPATFHMPKDIPDTSSSNCSL